jgi:DNA helicase-2/ATP-dependent DNA helicase PcrA
MGGRGGVRVSTPLQDAARAVQGSSAAAAGDAASGSFASGERVSHAKWGIGVIVSVKGTGKDMELNIAFPAPVGIKRLLAGFAPITKV